jgi:hypothetical protein
MAEIKKNVKNIFKRTLLAELDESKAKHNACIGTW